MHIGSNVSMLAVDAVFCVSALFEEVHSHFGELCIGENIFLLLHPLGALFAEGFQLGLQQISRTAGNGLLIADNLLLEFGVNRHRSGAVLTGNQALELVGAHLIALTGNDVEHSLGTHDLRGGGNQRRIKYSRISLRALRSKPVSYSVPLRAATIDSVGAWEVPSASGDIAVSIISAPASMPLSKHMEARPEV